VPIGLMIGSKVTGTKISACRNGMIQDSMRLPQPRRKPGRGKLDNKSEMLRASAYDRIRLSWLSTVPAGSLPWDG
jgi:hypothetical protein